MITHASHPALPAARDLADLAVEVVHRLVSTPSPSGSEGRAVEALVELAGRMGLQGAIDVAGNALALRPSRGPERARIVLLGHIDTVPGDIPVRIENGVLHGRGSVDAKGPLAAMLVAAARATVAEGVALEVIGAVGEETARSPGARFVRDRRRPAACIVGEPSGWDGVTLGYKGRLRLSLAVAGPCGHSAGPEPSACDIATAWWGAALERVHTLNAGHQGAFDTIRGSVIAIESSDDGLRQTARVDAGFRLPTWMAPTSLQSSLPVPAAPRGFELTVSAEGLETAHASDRNDPVVRALTDAIRRAGGTPRPKLKTGTADLNVVAPVWRCPIAAYGPGDSRLDHTPMERLALHEYKASIDVIETALTSLSVELADGGPPAV